MIINNNAWGADEWQALLYFIVTTLFVIIVILKILTNKISSKLDSLKNRQYVLDPCPFCGSEPIVKNGYFFCKKCKLMMFIPLRVYKNEEEMLNATWNRRWGGNNK